MEIQEDIVKVLTNDSSKEDTKLQALRHIKEHFKPPDKIFSKIKLDCLIPSVRVSLESKKQDKNFLFRYGTSLLSVYNRSDTLNLEILSQLEYILSELEKEDESLKNGLINKLWQCLDNGSVFQQDSILNASQQVVEKTVLDWIDIGEDCQFLSKMSADSPKLFQMITSILYEVLVRTDFHEKVLKIQKSFVLSVKQVCQAKGKNFLGLYPKGCRRLVSLLMVPPKVYAEGKEDVIGDVVLLLVEMFLSNRKKALILLSHYSDWVSVFKMNLEQTDA